MSGLRIALERPDQPEVLALVDALDAYQKPLYPAESFHGIDLPTMLRPNVLFAVVRDATGAALGCGAAVLQEGFAELKRMYVRPEARGRGAALRVIAFLEQELVARGVHLVRLETGTLQPEALGLYARCGFVRRGPFGGYGPDPLSVFMEKTLPPPGGPGAPACG
ncbi:MULTISPECIES: GNAT family N-acetyltransferase [Ramlibacter]|uniref:GNAT family N-acetyltransferase n=1 Tax=Ramlibacter TaxID=174951 RepID=UPI002AAF0AD2|nr:GNAT family N-acetyltransferase [Ramlibacter aquaticus]